MKYSFMSFSCPDLTLDEMLALAGRLGYDGIEPRLAERHWHGIETGIDAAARREIKRKVAASGVALACLATSCSYADPTNVEQMVAETRRCIDLAGDVGCTRLRVFGGELPECVSREEALDRVTEALRSMAAQALERRVTLCVETHDDWSHPSHLAEVMRRVNSPAIAINWDIMHPVRQGGVTMDEAYRTLRPWIRHVHLHDAVNTLDRMEQKPIGEGGIDHRRAVELLKAASYDGYLSGEWFEMPGWEPYEIHLPRELATMKRYEREAL